MQGRSVREMLASNGSAEIAYYIAECVLRDKQQREDMEKAKAEAQGKPGVPATMPSGPVGVPTSGPLADALKAGQAARGA